MERFFKNTRRIFFAEQGGIFSSALIISAMIVVSRIFGFLRYRILAGYFNKENLDIFFASFRIPDLVFEILITGALTSSFIPIFIKYQKKLVMTVWMFFWLYKWELVVLKYRSLLVQIK